MAAASFKKDLVSDSLQGVVKKQTTDMQELDNTQNNIQRQILEIENDLNQKKQYLD